MQFNLSPTWTSTAGVPYFLDLQAQGGCKISTVVAARASSAGRHSRPSNRHLEERAQGAVLTPNGTKRMIVWLTVILLHSNEAMIE